MDTNGQDNDVQPFLWIALTLALGRVLVRLRRWRRRRLERLLNRYASSGEQEADADSIDLRVHMPPDDVDPGDPPADDDWHDLPDDPIGQLEEELQRRDDRSRARPDREPAEDRGGPGAPLHPSRARIRLAAGLLIACLAVIALLVTLVAFDKLSIVEAGALAWVLAEFFARLDIVLAHYFHRRRQ